MVDILRQCPSHEQTRRESPSLHAVSLSLLPNPNPNPNPTPGLFSASCLQISPHSPTPCFLLLSYTHCDEVNSLTHKSLGCHTFCNSLKYHWTPVSLISYSCSLPPSHISYPSPPLIFILYLCLLPYCMDVPGHHLHCHHD